MVRYLISLVSMLLAGVALAGSDEPPTLLSSGDSQTYWQNATNTSYAMLMPSHFQVFEVVHGVGASCESVVDEVETWIAANVCPSVVTLMCGTNDCAVGGTCTDDEGIAAVVAEVERFVTDIETCGGIPVVLTPPPLRSNYTPSSEITDMGNFSAAVVVSGTANGYRVVDIWQAMMDYGDVSGQDTDDLISNVDQLHINTAADALISRTVNAVLNTIYEPPNPNILY